MLKLITVSSRGVDAECSNLGYVKVQATDTSAFLIDRDDGLPFICLVIGKRSSVIIRWIEDIAIFEIPFDLYFLDCTNIEEGLN
jgi:hypothetical protein